MRYIISLSYIMHSDCQLCGVLLPGVLPERENTRDSRTVMINF